MGSQKVIGSKNKNISEIEFIAKGDYFKFGCSYKNLSLRKSLISDAMHCKIASCKLQVSLTEDINEIN